MVSFDAHMSVKWDALSVFIFISYTLQMFLVPYDMFGNHFQILKLCGVFLAT